MNPSHSHRATPRALAPPALAILLVVAMAPGPADAQDATGTIFGDPVDGLDAVEFELFTMGREDFLEVEEAAEGLGPVFNGRSCGECHAIPAVGGFGTIIEQRAGILDEAGNFTAFPGGSLFQLFSLPPHGVQARIPSQANSTAGRRSLPLFGSGLVEAVPDALLLELEDPDDVDGDGISGRATRIFDRATRRTRIGRFGWKAQQATLLAFGAEAYRDEMGITNDLFVEEVCPWGVDCRLLARIDPLADPEDARDPATGLRGIDLFDFFMRFLGAPPRGTIDAQVSRGESVFLAIGCDACHTPALETGEAASPALSFRRFFPYGDFLLHDIGTGDGIAQEDSAPNEVRTPPLWGLRVRRPLLHDGRAAAPEDAILLHRGEAEASRAAFLALLDDEIEDLLAFLDSL